MDDVKRVLRGVPILEPWLLEEQIEEGAATMKTERKAKKKLLSPVLTCVVSLSTWRAVTGPLLDENRGMWMNVFITSYSFTHQSSISTVAVLLMLGFIESSPSIYDQILTLHEFSSICFYLHFFKEEAGYSLFRTFLQSKGKSTQSGLRHPV